jgi:hypothetical protein
METTNLELDLESDLLILIDPLALDGLKGDFDSELVARIEADVQQVTTIPFLRVGVHRIPDFVPGRFRLAPGALLEGGEDDDPRVFEVDSGTVVVVELRRLPEVAQVLTWDRYDWYLQSPVGDSSRWEEIVAEVGTLYFALLDDDETFDGDGRYRLRPDAFIPLR